MAKSCKFQWKQLYSVYVLLLLMAAYLTNQADRFVLGISSEKISTYLDIGHEGCYPNISWSPPSIVNGSEPASCSHYCQSQKDEDDCLSEEGCSWGYLPIGIKYQILAGPAFIMTFAVSSLLMGFLASIPSLRRTLVLSGCIIMWSVMTLLTGFITQYWEIVLARFGLGIFQAACTPFASSILAEYFKPEYRGTALSIYSWGVYIGYGLAFAFNFIVESYGWRWAFRIASFPGFIAGLLLLLTVKEPKRKGIESEREMRPLMKTSSKLPLLFKRVITSYLQLPLLLLCIGAGLRQGGGLVWAYNAKSYYRLTYCDVHGVGTYISWVPVVGGSVGVVVGGYISDKLVRRWDNKARISVLVVCSFLAIPFLFGTLYLPLPAAFFSLLAAYGVGEMWFGVCIAVAIELVPLQVSSAAVSLYLFLINIIGGNLNLLLPPLQRSMGLRYSMILLFPGAYFMAGVFFILAGLSWNIRYIKPTTEHDEQTIREESPLLQNINNGGSGSDNDEDDDDDMLTESQELIRRTTTPDKQAPSPQLIAFYHHPEGHPRALSVSYTAPTM